ncbi:MAG TPA: hypothetical protein VHM19_17350 [Polyangiales bacterium]|jgi:hypothetical protein|nr:hypothetical protein [Polyangiales bacterium]
MNRFVLAVAFGLVLVAASPARAAGPSLWAGVLGGYASTTDKQHDVEPYGVGLGASAGVTLPVMPFYVGARVVRYFGDSAKIVSGAGSLKLESQYTLYGLDLGYDASLGPITLRPGLGIGSAALKNSGAAAGVTVSASDSSLYLAPNIGLIVSAGLLYVGGELRFNALTEDKHFNSVSMLASLGLTI